MTEEFIIERKGSVLRPRRKSVLEESITEIKSTEQRFSLNVFIVIMLILVTMGCLRFMLNIF
ncbi:unnamed protein product [Oikopleura dioica]|uniref:Uncharacterized protein n=1 Tax=Oikopleura dioica TaxID=34765 RepID=E4Y3Y5_OIKDI|nr:unnamed protein product [Oikopleura dioica]